MGDCWDLPFLASSGDSGLGIGWEIVETFPDLKIAFIWWSWWLVGDCWDLPWPKDITFIWWSWIGHWLETVETYTDLSITFIWWPWIGHWLEIVETCTDLNITFICDPGLIGYWLEIVETYTDLNITFICDPGLDIGYWLEIVETYPDLNFTFFCDPGLDIGFWLEIVETYPDLNITFFCDLGLGIGWRLLRPILTWWPLIGDWLEIVETYTYLETTLLGTHWQVLPNSVQSSLKIVYFDTCVSLGFLETFSKTLLEIKEGNYKGIIGMHPLRWASGWRLLVWISSLSGRWLHWAILSSEALRMLEIMSRSEVMVLQVLAFWATLFWYISLSFCFEWESIFGNKKELAFWWTLLGGMSPKELLDDAALVHCFIENNKSIERMQWKNNDAQEFCQGCLPLLKGLSKTSPNPPKSKLRQALQAAKLSISRSGFQWSGLEPSWGTQAQVPFCLLKWKPWASFGQGSRFLPKKTWGEGRGNSREGAHCERVIWSARRTWSFCRTCSGWDHGFFFLRWGTNGISIKLCCGSWFLYGETCRD